MHILKKVYRFWATNRAGNPKQKAGSFILLPCRIAAQRRSSRSSALLYPPLNNSILSPRFFCDSGLVFVIKMGSFSM